MSDAISLVRRATREEARILQRIASEPMQKRALDAFRKAVDRALDAKAALRDPGVLGVLVQALGIRRRRRSPGWPRASCSRTRRIRNPPPMRWAIRAGRRRRGR